MTRLRWVDQEDRSILIFKRTYRVRIKVWNSKSNEENLTKVGQWRGGVGGCSTAMRWRMRLDDGEKDEEEENCNPTKLLRNVQYWASWARYGLNVGLSEFQQNLSFLGPDILSVIWFDLLFVSIRFENSDIRKPSKANTKNQYPLKSKQITNIKILGSGYPIRYSNI